MKIEQKKYTQRVVGMVVIVTGLVVGLIHLFEKYILQSQFSPLIFMFSTTVVGIFVFVLGGRK